MDLRGIAYCSRNTLATERVVRLSQATQPKWSVASNADALTALTSVHPGDPDVAGCQHGQFAIIGVPGLQEHLRRHVSDGAEQ